MDRYDLVVLGGGSAGLTAARLAARLGARVLLAERDRLGGDCLWTGCVPSKALLHAAAQVHAARQVGAFGLSAATGPADFAAVMAVVKQAMKAIEPHDAEPALNEDGVEVVFGEATFSGPRAVRVGEREVGFRFALIATGSSPVLPPIPGLTDAVPLTSDDVWYLQELPARLVVLGGGPIGCELGQAFARLGSRVAIVEAEARLLPREEPAASALLKRRLTDEGVRVLTGWRAERVEPGRVVGADSAVEFDQLLAVTGRRANTAGLGLDAAGIETDSRGVLRLDRRLRTTNARVFAAGDASGRSAFTHLAGVQAASAVVAALTGVRRGLDYDAVPGVTFTDPEVARVGLTAGEAAARHGARSVTLRTLPNGRVDRAVADRRTDGFTQLVLGPRGRIVGATVVCPRAGETIAHLGAAIRHRWTASQYAATIHPYPTYADGPWNAALAEVSDRLTTPAGRRMISTVLRVRRILKP